MSEFSEFEQIDDIEELRRRNEKLERDLRSARARIRLDKVPPVPADELHKLPLELLEGDRVRFGVVSDTHLSSKACALSELHLAYDWFERSGITTVYHAGDFTAGVGIYKGQHTEITRHTFEDQVEHLANDYPYRKGIQTLGIAGNHDLEGEFSGADPVRALADKRDDITYLGPYSAYVEIAPDCEIHLLHGKGGGAYALSYKLQKLAEAYPAGHKPAALIVGHFHSQITLQVRGVQAMFPGCFEWQSTFGLRLGLQPQVGFHVIEATIGDDGSIVGYVPEWRPFWEGRRVSNA